MPDPALQSYAYRSWKTAIPAELDGDVLLCPSCGGNYLHHGCVEIYDRLQDAETGLAVRVRSVWAEGESTVSTSMVMTYNPSPRRQGLRIRFWCENCHAEPWLRLWQHKGQTLIDWDLRAGEQVTGITTGTTHA